MSNTNVTVVINTPPSAPAALAPPPVVAPQPLLPYLPSQLPLPLPPRIIVPQPVVILVPVLLPPPPLIVPQVVAQPCLVPSIDLLPGLIPIAVPDLDPGVCLAVVPVIVPQPAVGLLPPLQLQVLPALGQVLPPEPFYETPVQFLPFGPDDQQFLLDHPLLFCPIEDGATCEELAEQLAEVTPGFSAVVTDGPDGYGVYVTYTPGTEAWTP